MKLAKAALLLPLLSLSADGVGNGCQHEALEPRFKRFRAVGFGTSAEDWATVGQNQLLAIRTARLDAYRTMAEQVYGFRLTGTTTISSMMVKSDRFRIHVDALIRGAEVVSVQQIADEVYEVVLEMTMRMPDKRVGLQCSEPHSITEQVEERQVPNNWLANLIELLRG